MPTITEPPQRFINEPETTPSTSSLTVPQLPLLRPTTREEAVKLITGQGGKPDSFKDSSGIVLIGLMLDFENNKWILDEITPAHFSPFLIGERRAYELILEIESSGGEVGTHTVLGRWPEEGPSNREWATKQFGEWRQEYEADSNLPAAVDALKHRFKVNQLSQVLRRATDSLTTLHMEPNVVAADTATALDRLTGSTDVATTGQRELNEATLLALTSEPPPLFSTGFKELDKRIGGLLPGRTYMVGARTGVGKSAFLLNLIHALGVQGIPTGFISLEMDQLSMNKRLIGIVGRVESSVLKPPMSSETLARIHGATAEMDHWPFVWTDKRGMTLADLRSKLKEFQRRGCRVVFVDYIQRVVVDGKEPNHQKIGHVARTLADLAERLNIAVVAAVQMNREGAKAEASLELHHIAESTVIEESADVIILLSTKKKEDETQGQNRPMKLHVAKNRHGFGGWFDIYFCGRQFRFSETPFISGVGFTHTIPAASSPTKSNPPPVPEMSNAASWAMKMPAFKNGG